MDMAASAELERESRMEHFAPVIPSMPLVGIIIGSVIGILLWVGIILGLMVLF